MGSGTSEWCPLGMRLGGPVVFDGLFVFGQGWLIWMCSYLMCWWGLFGCGREGVLLQSVEMKKFVWLINLFWGC